MITNIVEFLHTTAAYQAAVVQLMIGEANFAATQLEFKDFTPITVIQTNEWTVQSPAVGVGGTIVTSNYLFEFQKGQLRSIEKIDWFQRISPPVTNMVELAYRPFLLDTNSAYQFATQCLQRLSIDVTQLERRAPPNVWQSPVRKPALDGKPLSGTNDLIPTPIFKISWGDKNPPMDFSNPLHLKILGTTKELLSLSIRDISVFQKSALVVTNAKQLLGSFPPPRHFIEQLVGGREAYETVLKPEQVQAWLLHPYDQTGPGRVGPVLLKPSQANLFSTPLLDLNSYAWQMMKLCTPDYGAKLRFVRGKDSVEFLLCFECDILQVTHKGHTREENFDYGHNQLVRALRSVFPQDKIVKKIEFNDDKPEDYLKSLQEILQTQ